jgi:hypothetical protein
VLELIAQAKKQLEFCQRLQNSLLSDYSFVHFSPNVESYYSGIVTHYLDTLSSTSPLLQSFARVDLTEEAFVGLLKRQIDELIASNRCFTAAFDEEMKLRIGNTDSSNVVKEINNKLLGHSSDDSNACWNTPYALNLAYQGILMNLSGGTAGNLLFQILQNMFQKQNIDYFDTGSSDAVEAVAVYPLTKQHLFGSHEDTEGGTL